MTYTFKITPYDTEIFRKDDDAATPVVLVPVLDGETPDSHAMRVKGIVDAMNAMDDPARVDRTGGVVNLIEAMHALAAQCWDKAPHESDPEFAEAFVHVGDMLGVHGQDIHEEFDRQSLDAMLGGEWVRKCREVDDLRARAAAADKDRESTEGLPARILEILEERHRRYSTGTGRTSGILALEVENTMLRIRALMKPQAD